MKANVITLYRDGHSMRGISRISGLTVYKIRAALIDSGDLVVVHRSSSIVDGKAQCIRCEEYYELSEFSDLSRDCRFVCGPCRNKDNHRYQMRKQDCSVPQYRKLFDKQKGKCAICGAVNGHRSKYGVACRLAVDHDHDTGDIRGLLCNVCNRGLGYLRDSVDNLKRAVDYLEKRK